MGRPRLPRITCEYCGKEFPRPQQRGPIPKFCSVSHRQRNYEETRIKRMEAQNRELQRKLKAAERALELSTMRAKRGNEKEFHKALEVLQAA